MYRFVALQTEVEFFFGPRRVFFVLYYDAMTQSVSLSRPQIRSCLGNGGGRGWSSPGGESGDGGATPLDAL